MGPRGADAEARAVKAKPQSKYSPVSQDSKPTPSSRLAIPHGDATVQCVGAKAATARRYVHKMLQASVAVVGGTSTLRIKAKIRPRERN
jgi:hypothetical protein